jgi:hypothetical protein
MRRVAEGRPREVWVAVVAFLVPSQTPTHPGARALYGAGSHVSVAGMWRMRGDRSTDG